jgi:hypothetical protein
MPRQKEFLYLGEGCNGASSYAVATPFRDVKNSSLRARDNSSRRFA